MKIDVNNALTIILGLIALVGAIYRLGQVEANIYAKISKVETNLLAEIDKVSDSTIKDLHQIQMDFSTHKADYSVRKEWHTETAHGLKQMIRHKFSRLNYHIIDIQRHLEKHSGFIVRSQPIADPDEDDRG
jgi:hypothetical protein